MNSFIAVMTLIALSLFLNNEPAQSLEKQAVSDTQRTLASDLDAELPRLPFTDWFGKVVGPGVGVVWQLSECGERNDAAPNGDGDTQACVEVNTILSDGRKVIVMIAVGTFKKGVTGPPVFRFGVIEQAGKLYLVRRLSDLQRIISTPGSLASRPAVDLPEANIPTVKLATNSGYIDAMPTWNGEEVGRLMQIEEPSPPAPPPLRADLAPPTTTPTEDVKLLGSISWGDVIKKAQPRYPARAKRVNASGPVKVQITIAEDGHVIVAKAISGHLLLRDAAEEAARQWVFKPAVLNGAQVKTETVLVFIFTAPQ